MVCHWIVLCYMLTSNKHCFRFSIKISLICDFVGQTVYSDPLSLQCRLKPLLRSFSEPSCQTGKTGILIVTFNDLTICTHDLYDTKNKG